MSKEEKIKLVERLINEKAITFTEGLALIETEKEYIFQPSIPYYIPPNIPHTYPSWPNPNITCGLTAGENVSPLTIGTYNSTAIN